MRAGAQSVGSPISPLQIAISIHLGHAEPLHQDTASHRLRLRSDGLNHSARAWATSFMDHNRSSGGRWLRLTNPPRDWAGGNHRRALEITAKRTVTASRENPEIIAKATPPSNERRHMAHRVVLRDMPLARHIRTMHRQALRLPNLSLRVEHKGNPVGSTFRPHPPHLSGAVCRPHRLRQNFHFLVFRNFGDMDRCVVRKIWYSGL